MTALMGLTTRIKLAKLCLITDIRAQQGDFGDFVAAVFDGGVDLIEVRDESADAAALGAALEAARSIALNRNKGVVVGGDLEVARTFQADFLHLGAAGASTTEGRRFIPPDALIGRSVHSTAQLDAAVQDSGVAYLYVGPVFDPDPHDDLVYPGLDLVRQAAGRARPGVQAAKPWFAVGGINQANLAQVLDAGALRVAVSSAVSRADDPGAAAQVLKSQLQAAWDARPDLESYVLGSFGGDSGKGGGFTTPTL